MIRLYDKDKNVFNTYTSGQVVSVDEIEFNADTRIDEKYNILDGCEALIILCDGEFRLLLQAKSVKEAEERLQKAVVNGYLILDEDENYIEVLKTAFH